MDLPPGGALIVNRTRSRPPTWPRPATRPTRSRTARCSGWNLFEIPISTLNARALEGLGHDLQADGPDQELLRPGAHVLAVRAEHGARRSTGSTAKFGNKPVVAEANTRALKAGYAFGETTEIFHTHYRVKPASAAAGHLPQHHRQRGDGAGHGRPPPSSPTRPLFYGSYPITPASDILHQLSTYKHFGVKTFQAEDEIAAIGSAIGASYGGALGLTASSGPGIALKTEAMGLAVMVELPLVVVDVQRAGPSTGMPTKIEQSDLLQVMYGRNGDAPIPVVAPATPAECFDYAVEAWRIALKYMTPVAYLSDAFLATGSEPWRVPAVADLPSIAVDSWTDKGTFRPYLRDPRDARAAVGRARHARPGAPHRRPGEGGCHGQHQLRPGQPPPDDRAAPREGGAASRTTSRTSRSSGRRAATCWSSAGAPPTARIRSAVERLQARGSRRRPRPPTPPQPVPAQHR